MFHTSVKLETPCEIINVVPLNPLISKCQIKVCYVSDEPNRNKSVITKDVARQLANSLPGSPIVGFYNEAKGDFEEHNRSIDIANGKIVVRDTTRPYGFVDLGAKVWFQKYLDDGKIEREYMVTEGYLWTGQYPECQRVIDKGNNHSMELDDKTLDASWTKYNNGKPKFFIINEALISKLCILGEDCEPCFEGSNITPTKFSFDSGFKHKIFSMMEELKDLKELMNKKGGTQVFTKYSVAVGDNLWNQLYDNIDIEKYSLLNVLTEGEQLFAVLQDRSDNTKYSRIKFSLNGESVENISDVEDMAGFVPFEEAQFALADVEAFETSFKKKKEDEEKGKGNQSDPSKTKDTTEGDDPKKGEGQKGDPAAKQDPKADPEDDKEKDKKKKKYSLEEIPEYVELSTKYANLEIQYNALLNEVEGLRKFKLDNERVQKQEMIDRFYMLSDEDKKDVVDNIDTYSLDTIEAKLSILCVRNKVDFSLGKDEQNNAPTTFSFNGTEFNDETTPAWVKAAMEVEKEMK